MKKIYNYENSVITVVIPETNSEILRDKTKTFLKQVIKEKDHGNINTTRDIGKK